MLCTLCYESSEDSIDLTSDEAIELQVPSTLYKHFQFCFEVENIEIHIWIEASDFIIINNFYSD